MLAVLGVYKLTKAIPSFLFFDLRFDRKEDFDELFKAKNMKAPERKRMAFWQKSELTEHLRKHSLGLAMSKDNESFNYLQKQKATLLSVKTGGTAFLEAMQAVVKKQSLDKQKARRSKTLGSSLKQTSQLKQESTLAQKQMVNGGPASKTDLKEELDKLTHEFNELKKRKSDSAFNAKAKLSDLEHELNEGKSQIEQVAKQMQNLIQEQIASEAKAKDEIRTLTTELGRLSTAITELGG